MDLNSGQEEVLELVADSRNREILTLVDDADRPLHVNRLAERLVAREVTTDGATSAETDGTPPAGTDATAPAEIDGTVSADADGKVSADADGTASAGDLHERVLISLHHHRLPKLADAGLVEYDPDANVVRRSGPAVDAEWEDLGVVDELLDRFHAGDEADETAVGVIEGRDDVIEHGRRLADAADEELFLVYDSTDLLEDECVRRARDAVERGVDIFLGSQNPDVRELTRRELPEATIWEPQLDWTNVPSRYPKVGRLVVADRERVMLGLLSDPDSDYTTGETAMVGAGEDNPLVVLVRELLGPRLDHLDYQSEDFRSELPF